MGDGPSSTHPLCDSSLQCESNRMSKSSEPLVSLEGESCGLPFVRGLIELAKIASNSSKIQFWFPPARRQILVIATESFGMACQTTGISIAVADEVAFLNWGFGAVAPPFAEALGFGLYKNVKLAHQRSKHPCCGPC